MKNLDEASSSYGLIDPSAGRAGMRAFVVEGGTKGVKVVKLEHKMGIRVSDTAAISLVDARASLLRIFSAVPPWRRMRLQKSDGDVRCDASARRRDRRRRGESRFRIPERELLRTESKSVTGCRARS
ncbi:MAG: hypothetical protein U0X87_16570 [Anaerolineales bacterium]